MPNVPLNEAVRAEALLARDTVKAFVHLVILAKPLHSVLHLFFYQVFSGSSMHVIGLSDVILAQGTTLVLNLIDTACAKERCAAFRANHHLANDELHTDVALSSFVWVCHLRHI